MKSDLSVLYAVILSLALVFFYLEVNYRLIRNALSKKVPVLTDAQAFDHILVTERLTILRDLIIETEDELDLIEESKEADSEKVKRLATMLDAYRNSYANLMVINKIYLNKTGVTIQ